MPSPGASSPVQRAVVETGDRATAHELLSQAYGEHRLRFQRPPAGFVFRSEAMLAGDLSVDRFTYRGWVKAVIDPIDYVIVSTVLDGRLSFGPDQRDRFAAGDAALIPRHRTLEAVWDHFTLYAVRIPLSAVTSLVRLFGVNPADLRFDGSAAVSAQMNRHWLTTLAYLSRMCTEPDPAIGHPLIRAAALNTVAAILAVFPNTTMSIDYTPGPGRVPPAAVRRATAYIDAHADQPITVDDIAAAAGISVRGLQAAFARHGDTTPTGYLRRARLHGAHRDLQTGDPARGDTVAAIARRWGFANPGRFAVEYRTAYGQPPSRTLRT